MLYQFKIDNTGDAVEDRVIQVMFTGTGINQTVQVRGPIAPPVPGAMNNQVSTADAVVTGNTNTVLGSSTGIQVFAGAREDPFFIDLEQFFRIIPDRKPSTGGLSQLPDVASASSFRAAGAAVDFVKGFNVLSIVVELPAAMLTAGGNAKIGVWGTIIDSPRHDHNSRGITHVDRQNSGGCAPAAVRGRRSGAGRGRCVRLRLVDVAHCVDAHDHTRIQSSSATRKPARERGVPAEKGSRLPRIDRAVGRCVVHRADERLVAAFRPNATTLQTTLATVLLPDMLIGSDRQSNVDGRMALVGVERVGRSEAHRRRRRHGPVGHLQRPARSYPGAVQAVGALPLCTDNIGSHSTFTATFPYLAAPK